MAITPGWLEKNYLYKLEIRDIPASQMIVSLGQTLSQLSVRKYEKSSDVRYAFLFYAHEANPIFTMYYDPIKKSGFVEGESVSFDERLNDWIAKNCENIFE